METRLKSKVASSSESKFQQITPPLGDEKLRLRAGLTPTLEALTSRTDATIAAYKMIVNGSMTLPSSTFTSEKMTFHRAP